MSERKLFEVRVLVREYDGDTKDVVQMGNIFQSSSMAHVAHDRAIAAIREVYRNSKGPVHPAAQPTPEPAERECGK
jgi:hypothetical protein